MGSHPCAAFLQSLLVKSVGQKQKQTLKRGHICEIRRCATLVFLPLSLCSLTPQPSQQIPTRSRAEKQESVGGNTQTTASKIRGKDRREKEINH